VLGREDCQVSEFHVDEVATLPKVVLQLRLSSRARRFACGV